MYGDLKTVSLGYLQCCGQNELSGKLQHRKQLALYGAELCRPCRCGSCAVVQKAHAATTMANVEVLPLVSVLLSAYTLYIVFVSSSACCEIAFDTHNCSFIAQCIYIQQRHLGRIVHNKPFDQSDSFDVSGQWSSALLLSDVDGQWLQQMSTRLTSDVNGPAAVIQLLNPLYIGELDDKAAIVNTSGSALRNLPLTCLFMRAHTFNTTGIRTNLQIRERMKVLDIPPSSCVFDVHIESLYSLHYYADAYLVSSEFVRAHPELPEPHAWMGVALTALDRSAEAAPVLNVARVLLNRNVSDQYSHERLALLKRMADTFFHLNETVAAEEMYSRAMQLTQTKPLIATHLCGILQPLARTHLALNMSQLAYVELLQYARDCPTVPENNVYLGKYILNCVRLNI
jgi:hypothetical protein